MTDPRARACVRAMEAPPPFTRYRIGQTERIYTNPYRGDDAPYPCPRPTALQAQYAAWIVADAARRGQQSAIDASRVMFTAGSIAGIDLLIRAYCEPGRDAICVQSPTFPLYAHLARANGVAVTDVTLTGDDFDRIDVEGVCRSQARLTFVCRPNNPVGSVLPWSALAAIAQRSEGLVVVDEAYIEFSASPSAVALLDLPNVVVLRTFSKAWGLAGVRAGAVLAHPDVIDTLRVIADPFAFDAPSQRAVAAALAAPELALAGVDRIVRQREALRAHLAALPGVRRVLASEANFLFVQLAHPFDFAPTDRLVAPSPVAGTLRVAIGTPEDDAAALELVAGLAST